MPDDEKTSLLHRFFEGDPLAHTDLRRSVRPLEMPDISAEGVRFRTLSELRTRAATIREERTGTGKGGNQRR